MRKLSLGLIFVFMLMGSVGCSTNVSDAKESRSVNSTNIQQSKSAEESDESTKT